MGVDSSSFPWLSTDIVPPLRTVRPFVYTRVTVTRVRRKKMFCTIYTKIFSIFSYVNFYGIIVF